MFSHQDLNYRESLGKLIKSERAHLLKHELFVAANHRSRDSYVLVSLSNEVCQPYCVLLGDIHQVRCCQKSPVLALDRCPDSFLAVKLTAIGGKLHQLDVVLLTEWLNWIASVGTVVVCDDNDLFLAWDCIPYLLQKLHSALLIGRRSYHEDWAKGQSASPVEGLIGRATRRIHDFKLVCGPLPDLLRL